MEIPLDDKFMLLSDRRQYILGEKFRTTVLHIGYYVDLGILLKDYVEMRLRTEKGITTVQQLIAYRKSLLKALEKALKPLEFRIEVMRKS